MTEAQELRALLSEAEQWIDRTPATASIRRRIAEALAEAEPRGDERE